MEAVNKAVYRHLLSTYGRQPGVWFGFATEIVRVFLTRIYVTVLMAQAASSLAAGDLESAKRNIVYFFWSYVFGTMLGSIGDLVATRSENKEYGRLMPSFHGRLTGKDMAFYRDHQTGYLAGLFRQHLDGTMDLVRLLRSDGVGIVLALVVPVFVLLAADWRLGLVAFGIVLVQFLYVMWASSKSNAYRKAAHEILRKVTGEVADEITNIVALKSGGLEKESRSKMNALAQEEVETFWLRRKTATFLDMPRSILTAAGVTAAFFVVVASAKHRPDSVGLIVLTLSYMFQIVRNVAQIPNLILKHDDLITKTYPTLAYLGNERETIRDPDEPQNLEVPKGAITIENVNFSYPSHSGTGRRIEVFEGLNIAIAGGEQIGIVGLSGAGKSTLASLLMRFDDVTGGAIRVDGTDIRAVRQSELRRSIAYVPQEPLLFHRSIRDNIAYFDEGASGAEIERAAEAAHAHEFIARLPDGYGTIVGERGVKLSGGQKQRVVIARAILKNAPIMIFDEATSALDSESEQIIQRALPKIIGKHTAIVIAHRLSTVAGLDRIIVMHEGRIVEQGAHEELLALGGRYAGLWRKQTTNGT
ncbi:MAG: hypothetical protein JWN01_135 [Patescibacteria group bacterium]|nr:hypothetical protein [Patescibacteria group bacterium]